MSWNCQNCKTDNTQEALKCESCGTARVAKKHWNCPNCETHNPDFFKACEVCGMAYEHAKLVPVSVPALGRILSLAEYGKPVWEVPGNIRVVRIERIPISAVKHPEITMGGSSDVVISAPAKAPIVSAGKKRKWLRWAAVGLGLAMFATGGPGALTLFLVGAGFLALNYRFGSGFKKRVDGLLGLPASGSATYREIERTVDRYEEGHRFPVMSLTFSAKGDQLVSVDRQGNLNRWNVERGEKRKSQRLVKNRFENMVIGKAAAYALEMGALKVYRPDATLKKALNISLPVTRDCGMALSIEQNYIALGTRTGDIMIWNSRQFNQTILVSELNDMVTFLQFLPGERYLLAGDENGALLLWYLPEKKTVFQDQRKGVMISAGAVTPAGNYYAAAYSDGEIRIWSFGTKKEIRRFNIRNFADVEDASQFAKELRFVPGSEKMATVDQHGLIQIWDWKEKEILMNKSFAGRGSAINTIAVSKTGTWLATGSDKGEIGMYRI